MRGAIGESWLRSSAAVTAMSVAGLALSAGQALAQDNGAVSSYRLPDPKQTTAPRAQGPVDPDNPYAAPARTPQPERTPAPAPTPSPSPAPTSAPRITIPAPVATSTERPRAERPTRTPQPEPTPTPSEAAPSRAAPAPAVTPKPTSTPTPETVIPTAEPTSAPSAAVTPEPAQSSSAWLIPALLAAGVAGALAWLVLRRRRQAEAPADEPVSASLIPEPDAEPAPVAPAFAPVDPAPTIAPAPLVSETMALATSFTPQAVRLSLVYATVQYRLEIANAGQADLPELQIRADLASAHASIGTREQLAPAPEQIEVKHTLPALRPGESATVSGEVRVPLQQVRPLVKGTAQFFVPLVRFVILDTDGAGVRRVFTLGPRDPGSSALASVRLDAGPRNLRDLDAREIEAARGFALDPMIVHS